MALSDEEKANIQQQIDDAPDWGGARFVYDPETPFEEANMGALVEWNGARWMYLAAVGGELFLAPLAIVRKRPLLVEPPDAPLDQAVSLDA